MPKAGYVDTDRTSTHKKNTSRILGKNEHLPLRALVCQPVFAALDQVLHVPVSMTTQITVMPCTRDSELSPGSCCPSSSRPVTATGSGQVLPVDIPNDTNTCCSCQVRCARNTCREPRATEQRPTTTRARTNMTPTPRPLLLLPVHASSLPKLRQCRGWHLQVHATQMHGLE